MLLPRPYLLSLSKDEVNHVGVGVPTVRLSPCDLKPLDVSRQPISRLEALSGGTLVNVRIDSLKASRESPSKSERVWGMV